MDCDLCCKTFTTSRQPLCPSCARTALYTPRIRHAGTILAREKVHNHAEAILRPGNDGVLAALSEDTDLEAITAETQRQGCVQSRAKEEAVQQRIEDVSANSQLLREHIEQYKEYRARQQVRIADRRSALQDARRQLEMERARTREPVVTAINKAQVRLEKVHLRTAEARLFLCHQIAMLLDLKRVKKDAETPSEYWLAGSPIPNLRHLCRPPPEDRQQPPILRPTPHEALTASFENVCRLLALCCHYLSVRLPAEISIPASGMVRYTILPERSSYQAKESGANVGNLTASTRSLGRGTGLSRTRALYLDRPLQAVSSEDAKGFQLFVESAMLLGWDIAWLSKTQGIDTINTFEDVSAIGRNLFNLFVRNASLPKRRPMSSRVPSADSTAVSTVTTHPTNVQFGMSSHANAYRAIHSTQGQSMLSGWRFGTVTACSRLIDKLANYLVAEMSRQEWDTIDEHEWDDEREDEQAVLVGGTRRPVAGMSETTTSVVTVGAGGEDQQKGQSGWMKVRGRVT